MEMDGTIPASVFGSIGDVSRPEIRLALVVAASAAFPVGELEIQALGGKSAWNTRTRPGRIEARTKAVRALIRAAEIAIKSAPELDLADMVAALRSMALRPADLLIDSLTGQWLASPSAVRHRGCELARALEELARVVNFAKQITP